MKEYLDKNGSLETDVRCLDKMPVATLNKIISISAKPTLDRESTKGPIFFLLLTAAQVTYVF